MELGGCEELGGVVVELGELVLLPVAGAFAAGVEPPASGACGFEPGAAVGWLACWSTLPEFWAAGEVAVWFGLVLEVALDWSVLPMLPVVPVVLALPAAPVQPAPTVLEGVWLLTGGVLVLLLGDEVLLGFC